MSFTHHLKINQGETFYKSFQWLLGEKKILTDNEKVDLSGYTARCQIRNGAQNPGILMVVPVEIIDEEKGVFAIALTAEQTSAIPANGNSYSDTEKYDYDVKLISPDGKEIERILNGKVVVSPEVTR